MPVNSPTQMPSQKRLIQSAAIDCGYRYSCETVGSKSRVSFLAYGCPPTLACGSILTELIQGKAVPEAMQLTRTELFLALGGLPSRKQHAAALAVETLRKAIESGCSELLSADLGSVADRKGFALPRPLGKAVACSQKMSDMLQLVVEIGNTQAMTIPVTSHIESCQS